MSTVLENHTQAVDTSAMARVVPFVYSKHSFGENRKASMARVEVQTTAEETKPDKNYLKMQKRLLQMPSLNAIRNHDRWFRDFLKNQAATPWKPTFWFVPVPLVETVADRAQAWLDGRELLADLAADAYEAEVATMPGKLGPLFNAADYPTKAQFRETFSAEFRFVEFGVPAALATMRTDVLMRERLKVEREAQHAMQLIRAHLRETLLELTAHLAKLLTPKVDGTFSAIRDHALDDLLAFLDTSALRDTTNDTALQDVIARLTRLRTSLDVTTLRDDKVQRVVIAAQVEEAKEQLSKLVTPRTRGIRVRDEEVV